WVSFVPYHTLSLTLAPLSTGSTTETTFGSVNAWLDFKGRLSSLLIASGSVDEKNTYVFEVHPQGIVESVAKSLSYWRVGDGDDTMVTVWNPADESQTLVFTLFFTGGHYNIPVRLGPKATRMFNISEIIQNQIPDDEGNLIPPTIHEGSADISGSQGENEHILVAMDAGTYNVRKATCGQFCVTCHGTVNDWITANPYAVGISTQAQLTQTVQFDTGTQYNITASSSWSSSAQSIATVSAGMVH